MKRKTGILVPLLAISVVLLVGYKGFGWENSLRGTELSSIIASFDISNPLKRQAWQVFENYLEFAKAHNLAGIRSLSHQISDMCNDPLKERECFALMDNVYAIGSQFKLSDFKRIQSDERQIMMYTDGPTVAILYFTRDEHGSFKVLGMRFCFEDETTRETCVETDPAKRDLDNNGWWDSVESLFYPN